MKYKYYFLILLSALSILLNKSYAQSILYGMTTYGGTDETGVLFEYNPDSNIYIKKYDFKINTTGSCPRGSIMQASNGKLYGMTYDGGNNHVGVLFEFNPVNNIYTKKIDFDGTKGRYPGASLIQATNGKLYGMTQGGGINGNGVIFEYNFDSNIYVKVTDFDGSQGSDPLGNLLQVSNDKLYGMTAYGGTNDKGVLFEFDIVNNIYKKMFDFDGAKGSYPCGSLIQTSNNKLYGLTSSGGIDDKGVLFEYNISTNTYVVKLNFDSITTGCHPYGSLVQASNGKLYGIAFNGAANDYGLLFEYDIVTNNFTKKVIFDKINTGGHSKGSLVQSSNGKLYGMTTYGGDGTVKCGVIFEYDPATNSYIKKLNFDGNNGSFPMGNDLIEIKNNVSIETLTKNKKIKIYPNPGSNILKIAYNTDFVMKIYNISGELLIKSKTKETNISKLMPGTYVILIYDLDSKLLKTDKLIIK
ncbi:MAG: T9SS type A sorting domain-containing protein [Bacteroidales bacterium]|nr:T9SS type A sorting domain-containing protein [Bacteroidales bacterium]